MVISVVFICQCQIIFDKFIFSCVPATENEFDKDYLTLTYEYYDDDHQDAAPDTPPEHLTPTPDIGDNYLNMELMLPCGGTLARGRVTERKRDHKGNVIGRPNANLILETREYKVKIEDGDVTELTENAIAESMYAMCDENGDHILLFDAIVDHKQNEKEMTRTEQNFVDSRGKRQCNARDRKRLIVLPESMT